MHLFKRDKVIAQLLDLLDIPRFILTYEVENCIGPSDPDFFAKYETRRLEQEEVAKAALENSTDEELWDLSETPRSLKSFSRKYFLFDPPPWYAGGFGVKIHKADFGYWAKMDFWTLEETTCLSIGFKPELVPDSNIGYKSLIFYRDRIKLFRRADFHNRKSSDQIMPKEFVDWARKKGIEIPNELDQAVNENTPIKRLAMLGSVDARKYDSAVKVILGLIANEYGYRTGIVEQDIKKATMSGLADLGLNIDRKTLNRLFEEVVKSADRFRQEQLKRDK